MDTPARPTILIVDDEPEVLHSLYALLRLHYRVLISDQSAEALSLLEKTNDLAVVMSDQRMPGMTGVDFLHSVERLRPDVTRLLFTGYADIKAVIEAINRGHVFRYLTKPWNPDELSAVLHQAVEHHELIQERNRLIEELKETNVELTEANRLKGAFIEVASHELNTPVAVVLGMTELWKMTQAADASPAERGWVDRIQAAGRRLAGTVERMLKLLRADQLDHTLDREPTDLESLSRDVVTNLEPFWRARGQEIHLEFDPDLGTAEIDPGKISDALTNLVVNAIKFTPDGGVIRVEVGPDGPDRVWFRVSDSGVGIAPAEHRHLFEPFFTGYDTRHHSSGDYQFGKRGIGLGLCLVKAFVELHGGTIEAASQQNQGSVFRFTLPRSPSSSSSARDPESDPEGAEGS